MIIEIFCEFQGYQTATQERPCKKKGNGVQSCLPKLLIRYVVFPHAHRQFSGGLSRSHVFLNERRVAFVHPIGQNDPHGGARIEFGDVIVEGFPRELEGVRGRRELYIFQTMFYSQP